jgi:hypothetical protein
MMARLAGLLGMVAFGGVALAEPGDLDRPEHELQAVTVHSATAELSSTTKTGLCFTAGGSTTVAVAAPSEPTTPPTKAPVVPRFSRTTQVASSTTGSAAATGPWTLELGTNLKKAALSGNALFVFFDLDDPTSVANNEVTALYQAKVKAGSKLSARLVLSPEEGFRARHTYRVRIAQLIGGKEVVLGEGDLSLL